jgi:GT2 family glycosyltransferase
MDVSVIIVNRNAGEALEACLQSVVLELQTLQTLESLPVQKDAQESLSGECLIIDNGSEPGGIARLRDMFPQVSIFVNADNLGFGCAANQGFARSQGRYVLLLNPDAELTPGSLRHLIDRLDAHPEAAILGPRVTNTDGTNQGSARTFPSLLTAFFGRNTFLTNYFSGNRVSRRQTPGFDPCLTQPQSADWVSGACMLIRRQAVEAVGGFDEQFFLYWEDADLCWRLHDHGWQIVYDPQVRVMHKVGGSSRHASIRSLLAFHRSAYLLYRKQVTGSAWHPLSLVAAVGLSVRAGGLLVWEGVRKLRR